MTVANSGNGPKTREMRPQTQATRVKTQEMSPQTEGMAAQTGEMTPQTKETPHSGQKPDGASLESILEREAHAGATGGEAQAIGVLHRRGEPLDGSPDPAWGVKVDFPTKKALYQNGVSSHTLFTKVDTDAKADALVTDILAVESHPNANGRKMRFSFQERDPAKETAFLAAINKAYREQRKLAGAHDWYSAPNKWSASDMEHLPWEQ